MYNFNNFPQPPAHQQLDVWVNTSDELPTPAWAPADLDAAPEDSPVHLVIAPAEFDVHQIATLVHEATSCNFSRMFPYLVWKTGQFTPACGGAIPDGLCESDSILIFAHHSFKPEALGLILRDTFTH